jgi:hypothetical protein
MVVPGVPGQKRRDEAAATGVCGAPPLNPGSNRAADPGAVVVIFIGRSQIENAGEEVALLPCVCPEGMWI